MPSNADTKWLHLPNAVHIDRVLASLKSYPGLWSASRHVVVQDMVFRNVVWKKVWEKVKEQSRDLLWESIWYEVWEAQRDEGFDPARVAVREALLCLTAYDDCAHMLDSEVGELKILAVLGDPRAILLLPACIAFNTIKELQNDI